MIVSADRVRVDPNFKKARDAIEDLHSALHGRTYEYSLGEVMSRLEAIYRRSGEETRYEILTNLIELEYIGARAVLAEALQGDDSALVRHEAAFGLGVLGNKEHVNTLIHAMLRDGNAMVRHEAAIALAAIGGEEALESLHTAAQDRCAEVAGSARYALQSVCLRIGEER